MQEEKWPCSSVHGSYSKRIPQMNWLQTSWRHFSLSKETESMSSRSLYHHCCFASSPTPPEGARIPVWDYIILGCGVTQTVHAGLWMQRYSESIAISWHHDFTTLQINFRCLQLYSVTVGKAIIKISEDVLQTMVFKQHIHTPYVEYPFLTWSDMIWSSLETGDFHITQWNSFLRDSNRWHWSQRQRLWGFISLWW